MAKNRIVNTKFWLDEYIQKLNQKEKLLFLYFLTNPYTDISGIYEIPFSHIQLETGFTDKEIVQILMKFEKDGKIFYENGWIGIKNFSKHQSSNPSVEKAIKLGFTRAPKQLVDKMRQAVTSCDSLPIFNLIKYNIIKDSEDKSSRAKSTTKKEDDYITSSEKPKIYSLSEEIRKLENSPRRDLNIIALFFDYKKPKLETYEQFQIALKRHLKPAKMLVVFSNEQIINAIEIAKKEYSEIYTLETLIKILTK